MRGHLHGDAVLLRVPHARERALEVRRLGSGQPRDFFAPGVASRYGPDAPCTPSGVSEDRLDHANRARLAVGSGYTDKSQRICGVSEQSGTHLGQSGSRVRDDGGGNPQPRCARCILHDQGRCTGLEGLGDEPMPVGLGAPQGTKSAPGVTRLES